MTALQSDRISTSDLYVEGPTPSRYWGDQWLRVAEKVLRGLNHELTNRASSVDAAVGLLQKKDARDASGVESLARESARLNELLQLYRALTGEPLSAPEAIRLQDLMPPTVLLLRHHCDLGHIPCSMNADEGTEPIIVRETALLRCALVLLASVAGNVYRSGREGSVQVEFGGDGEEVWLRMRGEAPTGQLLFSGEGSLLHAVRAALAHAHATADGAISRHSDGDSIEYELRFPTLAVVRKREL